MKRVLVGMTCGLIALEGLYFAWIAYSISTTIRLAPTGEAAEVLRHLAVANLARGLLLLIAAVAYGTNWLQIRRWLYLFSILALPYGIWSFHGWYALMISWKGLFTGDLVALGSASGIGFIAIGVLLVVVRVRRGGEQRALQR